MGGGWNISESYPVVGFGTADVKFRVLLPGEFGSQLMLTTMQCSRCLRGIKKRLFVLGTSKYP